MSFLVLVLGALLSFGGAAALYSGYGNVEVVRGWTAVIAGTTALSAGVMTIGISFVLRCLVRLQAFLEIERGLVTLLNEISINRDAYPRARSAGVEGAAAGAAQPAVLVAAATFRVGEGEAFGEAASAQNFAASSEPPIGAVDADERKDRFGEAAPGNGGL